MNRSDKTIGRRASARRMSLLFLAIAAAPPAHAIMNGEGQDIFPVPAVFQASATITYSNAVNAGLTVSSGLVVTNGNVSIGGDITAARYQISGSTVLAVLPGAGSLGVGVNAGRVNTGYYNSFLGYTAGYANTTGSPNTFAGSLAGHENTTGANNSFVGFQPGYWNTTGAGNSFVGSFAGRNHTKGLSNSFLGYAAGYDNTTGADNSFLGYWAGRYTKTGSANAIFGLGAGQGLADQSFSSSTLMGYRAGYQLTTGSDNIFLGWQSGYNVTTGSGNIIIGYNQQGLSNSANTLNIGGSIYGDLTTKNITFPSTVTVQGGAFSVGGSTLVVTGGNVGIGTASPTGKIHVSTGTGSTSLFVSGSGSTAGNVGIGTTNPGAVLDVNGTVRLATPAGKTNGALYLSNTSGDISATATGGAGTLCLVSATGGVPIWGACSGSAAKAWAALTLPSANLSFSMAAYSTNFTWTGGGIFAFNTTGNVGIGIASPGNYKLYVKGASPLGASSIYAYEIGDAYGTAYTQASTVNGVTGLVSGYPYHFGVMGSRYDDDYGPSGGVLGTVNYSNPTAWGALGFQDAGLLEWAGYFTGDSYFSGSVRIGSAGTPRARLDIADATPDARLIGVGDDTFLTDSGVENTLGIYGGTTNTIASVKLGSGGGTISGYSGNIGIGVADPDAKLEVAGQVKITGGDPGTGKLLTSDGVGLASWQATAASDNWGTQVVQTNATLTGDLLGINLANANTWTAAQTFSALTNFPGSGIWNASGNVGIGTTSPGEKLRVNGGIRALGGVTFSGDMGYSFFGGSGDIDGGMFSPAGGTLVFATNNTERVRINSSGNVGIGTASPEQRLHVESAADANKYLIYGKASQASTIADYQDVGVLGLTRGASSTHGYAAGVIGIGDQANSDGAVGVYAGLGTAAFAFNVYYFDTALYANGNSLGFAGIFTGGNVGIGTMNPQQPLQVGDKDNASMGLIKVAHHRCPFTCYYRWWDFGTGDTTSNEDGFTFRDRDFGVVMTLAAGGNVGIGTTNPGYKLQVGNTADGTEARANAWNLNSDARLKTNLSRLTDALDKLGQINGYYFNWNVGTDKRRQVGVIAQEVEKVLPEAVSEGSDGFKAVDYGKLAPLLIEAIKERQKTLEDLKARIEKLEGARGG